MALCFPYIKSLRPTAHKRKSRDFPIKTFRTLFFCETSLEKNIETPRCHCKHCWDFFTNRCWGRNILKAKTVVGKILMLKNIDINLSLIIFVVASFVSMHMMTNHWCVVTQNEMLSLYSSTRFCAWFNQEKLVFCSTNFKTRKNIAVCFQKMLSCLSNATQWKVFAYVLNSTCPVTWYVNKKFREKCLRMASLWMTETSSAYFILFTSQSG